MSVRQGYSREWAETRVKSLEIRAILTQEWKERGGARFYALLTEMLHHGALDIGTQEHMALKGFAQRKDGRYKGDLRPALTIRELGVLTFGETTAMAEHQENDSHGLDELKRDDHVAGQTAREARLAIERITGQQIVTSTNAIPGSDGGLWGTLPRAQDEEQ